MLLCVNGIFSTASASIAQIPRGSSRLDTTRSTCRPSRARRDERVERVDPVELVVSSVSNRAVFDKLNAGKILN